MRSVLAIDSSDSFILFGCAIPETQKARPSAPAQRHREAPSREHNQAAPSRALGSIAALLKIRGFLSAVTELTKLNYARFNARVGKLGKTVRAILLPNQVLSALPICGF
jgi:hypothetical protein